MIIPPIHLPFLPSDIPHSQALQIAQVVKDPGRELGEVVAREIPFGQKQGQGQKQPHSQSQTKQYEQAGGGRRDERPPQRGTMTDHERAGGMRESGGMPIPPLHSEKKM